MVACLMGASTGLASGYINHTFEDPTFTVGANFTNEVMGWQANTSAVVVVTPKASSGVQSVSLPGGSTLTNLVTQAGPTVVWTQLKVAPFLGATPPVSITNNASFASYFDEAGYLNVWSNNIWLVCSNDVWGGGVDPMANGVFADISIYQNYTSHRAAILVNDQVVLQDLPFAPAKTDYHDLYLENASSNAWLDDAYIQATYDAARLTQDRNGQDGPDAGELQTYGYVARTQHVGGVYGSFLAAMNLWRARDPIYVFSGSYTEDVLVSNAMTFVGGPFTNTMTLTIRTGGAPVFQSGMVWKDMTLDTNSMSTFVQPVSCSNLAVRPGAIVTLSTTTCSNATLDAGARLTGQGAFICPGTVSVAATAVITQQQAAVYGSLACTGTVVMQGQSLTLTSADVPGVIYVTGGGTAVVTSALSLPVGGHMEFAASRFIATMAPAVNMTGTFSISNDWRVGDSIRVSPNANCTFTDALACSSLVIRAGATVVCQALTCSNLTIEAGASLTCLGVLLCNTAGTVAGGATLTLSQNATFGTLDASGTVLVSAGKTLLVDSAMVSGQVQVTGAGIVTINQVLTVTGGGELTFSGSDFNAPADNVYMTGDFSLNSTWGNSAAVMGLDFIETFESYVNDVRLDALGFKGWGSSVPATVIKDTLGQAGTKGLEIAAAGVVSNRISTVQTKVWTDLWIKPNLGAAPPAPATNAAAIISYVGSDGVLNVWSTSGWVACSKFYDGSDVPVMTASEYARITLFLNFVSRKAAVFIDGKLAREYIDFPASVGTYGDLTAQNYSDNKAYLDNVRITVDPPADMTASLNGDMVLDTEEIHNNDKLTQYPRGSVYLIR